MEEAPERLQQLLWIAAVKNLPVDETISCQDHTQADQVIIGFMYICAYLH